MRNTVRGTIFEMTLVIIGVATIVVALPGAIEATINLIKIMRNQKSNRHQPK